MKTISILELKKNTQQIISLIQNGQEMVVTYRGKAVCRIEPLNGKDRSNSDPFYEIYKLADETAESLTNDEIDQIIYES